MGYCVYKFIAQKKWECENKRCFLWSMCQCAIKICYAKYITALKISSFRMNCKMLYYDSPRRFFLSFFYKFCELMEGEAMWYGHFIIEYTKTHIMLRKKLLNEIPQKRFWNIVLPEVLDGMHGLSHSVLSKNVICYVQFWLFHCLSVYPGFRTILT